MRLLLQLIVKDLFTPGSRVAVTNWLGDNMLPCTGGQGGHALPRAVPDQAHPRSVPACSGALNVCQSVVGAIAMSSAAAATAVAAALQPRGTVSHRQRRWRLRACPGRRPSKPTFLTCRGSIISGAANVLLTTWLPAQQPAQLAPCQRRCCAAATFSSSRGNSARVVVVVAPQPGMNLR